jgi:Spermine/spermidine synthase domain
VISLAMFGMGFGGMLVFHYEEQFKHNIDQNLYLLSIFLAISILFCLEVVTSFHLSTRLDLLVGAMLIMVYLFCTAPFVFSSMILAILFLNSPKRSSYIYGADLMGAAIGCIMCIVLITYLSAQQILVIASMLSIIASILFNSKKVHFNIILTLVVLAMLGMFANTLFQITQTKSYSELNFNQIYEKWSPLSRITVHPHVFFRGEDVGLPFGWSLSETFKPKRYFKQLWIEQDSSAGSPIVPFDGDYTKVDYLKYDITAIPYYLRKKAKVFILGVGGGRDVLTALMFNNKKVTGVDIHPVIVDLVKNKFSEYAGKLYAHKKVDIHIAEGRNFLASHDNKYDIIQIPLIDSWAATVSGAFTMAENSLYTLESFETYLNHLSTSGLLSVSRFYFTPNNQTLKLAILARASLEKTGVTQPKKHIAIIKNSVKHEESVANILVKRTAFSKKEIVMLENIADKLSFDIVYLPNGKKNEALFEEAMTTNDLSSFFKSYYYDIRPTTDDRPFFFQMLYLSKALDVFNKKLSGQIFNYYGVTVLYLLLIISTFLVCLFYFVPLIINKKTMLLSLSWGAYFILLGLGFMFIEIPIIHIGALYLGGVTYGLSIGLFSLLFFGGVGCILSNQAQTRLVNRNIKISLVVIIAISGLLPIYLKWLLIHTIGYKWLIKCLLYIVVLTPLAIAMGVLLPSLINLSKERYQKSIPWFWALNGASSVLGSILAMVIAMVFGYSYTIIIGMVSYVLILIIFMFKKSLG